METVDQKRLRAFLPYAHKLNVDDVVVHLSGSWIDDEAKESLAKSSTSKKGSVLIELLITKAKRLGSSAVDELADALSESKQSNLARLLQLDISALVARLPTESIVKRLLEADVLTETDKKTILSHKTTEMKNEQLLLLLLEKPERVFEDLKRAVQKEENDELFLLICGYNADQARLQAFFPYAPLLDVDHLVIHLRSRWIDDEEAEEILSEKTTSKKGIALLELLIRKAKSEEEVVDDLAKALSKNKQNHLAHKLRPDIYEDDEGLLDIEKLIEHWGQLAAELPTESVVKRLFEDDALTVSDREMILSHETTEKRNDQLLRLLCKKPKRAFIALQKALRYDKHKLFFLFCSEEEKKIFEDETSHNYRSRSGVEGQLKETASLPRSAVASSHKGFQYNVMWIVPTVEDGKEAKKMIKRYYHPFLREDEDLAKKFKKVNVQVFQIDESAQHPETCIVLVCQKQTGRDDAFAHAMEACQNIDSLSELNMLLMTGTCSCLKDTPGVLIGDVIVGESGFVTEDGAVVHKKVTKNKTEIAESPENYFETFKARLDDIRDNWGTSYEKSKLEQPLPLDYKVDVYSRVICEANKDEHSEWLSEMKYDVYQKLTKNQNRIKEFSGAEYDAALAKKLIEKGIWRLDSNAKTGFNLEETLEKYIEEQSSLDPEFPSKPSRNPKCHTSPIYTAISLPGRDVAKERFEEAEKIENECIAIDREAYYFYLEAKRKMKHTIPAFVAKGVASYADHEYFFDKPSKDYASATSALFMLSVIRIFCEAKKADYDQEQKEKPSSQKETQV